MFELFSHMRLPSISVGLLVSFCESASLYYVAPIILKHSVDQGRLISHHLPLLSEHWNKGCNVPFPATPSIHYLMRKSKYQEKNTIFT